MVLRIGVLGAAGISNQALYVPAADTEGVEVVAIAARDRSRAQAHADQHGIARVHDTYADVLADPDVDAIYNPLAISEHHRWSIAAAEAGKHVLCEKPFASNATEAAEMVEAGKSAGVVMMEAFHWRYHPLAGDIGFVVGSRALGELQSIEASFSVEIPPTDEVRQSWELSGGALMDLGCYPIQWIRYVAGREPQVFSATMTEGRPNVDIITDVELDFGGGLTGHAHTAMNPGVEKSIWLRVKGSEGTLLVDNPLAPHAGHKVTLTIGEDVSSYEVEGRTTYHHQLEAFRDAVVDGALIATGGDDSINTMKIIDAAYLAAGLPVRGTAL
jgi:predicted dehydrogenase